MSAVATFFLNSMFIEHVPTRRVNYAPSVHVLRVLSLHSYLIYVFSIYTYVYTVYSENNNSFVVFALILITNATILIQ